MFHYVEKSILWVLCCNTRFPLWLSHLKSAYNSAGDCLQSRRPRFDLLVRKIPQRRNWRLSPVPFPGKSHRQRASGYSSWAHNKLNMIWQLNYHQQKKNNNNAPKEYKTKTGDRSSPFIEHLLYASHIAGGFNSELFKPHSRTKKWAQVSSLDRQKNKIQGFSQSHSWPRYKHDSILLKSSALSTLPP